MAVESGKFLMALPSKWWLALLLIAMGSSVAAQSRDTGDRDILRRHLGEEVLVMDTTSGTIQFQHPDALIVYRVTLTDVKDDYIMVTRTLEEDKRSFLYPIATIRRVITHAEGKRLKPIVIMMY